MNRKLTWQGIAVGLTLVVAALAPAPAPEAGKTYRVPYRLTDTNHFLVRVRVNGKGPFNFLVDTGAPALYVATETAKKVGLKPAGDDFWTSVERLDFEGGANLRDIKARVEDPFQLVGMNALGLPGASIDGILGFTALARFRITLDPTDDRMTWTRLEFEPRDPPAPPRRKEGAQPPGEMQAMNALGPLAKMAAALIGKQPEDELIPRGFVGLELVEGPGEGEVRIEHVLAGSPAAKAGVRDGDRLTRVAGHAISGLKDARGAVAAIKPGDAVALLVKRAGMPAELALTVTAGEGL